MLEKNIVRKAVEKANKINLLSANNKMLSILIIVTTQLLFNIGV